MTKLLDIREQTDVDASLLEMQIPLKKGATLYEDNEMVNYSLARWLETKISRELIRINQISGIEVVRHDGDLMFLIRFSLE